MDERAALALIADRLTGVSDDCAIVDDTVLTTDMLHERTDFPEGVTRYVCTSVDAVYVGGDLDGHEEFTVASTALGRTDEPVRRSGARAGDAVCVTGTLGRTATALRLFERDDLDRANELFRFPPRVAAGRALAPHATAMMDSSDGLARSAHQLADASGCSLALDEPLPIDESIREVADDEAEAHELGVFVGEDFELVCTLPESALRAARQAVPTTLSRIGTVTGADPTGTAVTLDGDPLPDRGYTH